MLDDVTKRRINTARDILVGKVPDPKSQVEQITIALIYKFMDDMDAEAEELGGKRTFFTGKYSRYGWRKIFDPKLSGFEMLSLYSEAVQQMNLIPTIPQLFRDIFKNAYLPYRDPETLKAFLKVINEFTYDHSERLGDAFEFLLSVLGSQGDAGQFRTPRHIIDFMVRIADPKKNERILDPACGTAGFLISSYKHILKQNSKEGKAGRSLSTDDRKKLAQHFRGYDISPDMVRLSLVNMYLHGFTQPNILEYDTLTSEERWNEYYDVIMANPPFMSPKGGIRPHKRFSVQSNRSEVLFVDYIAEHLTPNGRAAVIVPEGIIFQSGTAYKALRKMLVENYLWAIVSMPSGVFQPYSGVKTSILLIDKTLAKRNDSILFVKLQNDGFDLGAQRRPIDKSDLYFAEEILKHYQQHLQLENFDVTAAIKNAAANNKVDHETNDVPIVKIEFCQYLSVEKNKIEANGEYNLSGDRYKESTVHSTKWDYISLGVCCEFIDYRGKTPSKTRHGIRLVTAKNVKKGFLSYEPVEYIAEQDYNSWMTRGIPKKGDVLFTTEAPLGNVAQIDTHEKIALAQRIITLVPKNNLLDRAFLKSVLLSEQFQNILLSHTSGSTVYGIKASTLKNLQIPHPPLSIQQQIVSEIEGYQKVIDGARKVVDNYKPTIRYEKSWQSVELGTICDFEGGTQPPKDVFIKMPKEGYIRLLQIRDYKSDKDAVYIPTKERHNTCSENDIMIGRYGPPVFQILRGKAGAYNVALMKCVPDKKFISEDWLYYFLLSGPIQAYVISLSERVRQSGVRPDDLRVLKIPLPTLEEQEEIIRQLEMETLLVKGNSQLIARMEQKAKDTIAQVWGNETIEPEENDEVTIASQV